MKGQPLDWVKAADVMKCLFLPSSSVVFTSHFVGRIIKKVFPDIQRKRIHSCWYYYGIKHQNQTNVSTSDKPVLPNSELNVVKHPKPKKQALDIHNISNNEKKAYTIPSLNICQGDLQFRKEDISGEGTFGKCFSGKYKELPVAVKVFKDKKRL